MARGIEAKPFGRLAWLVAEVGVPGLALILVLGITSSFIAPLFPFIALAFLITEFVDAIFIWRGRLAEKD